MYRATTIPRIKANTGRNDKLNIQAQESKQDVGSKLDCIVVFYFVLSGVMGA